MRWMVRRVLRALLDFEHWAEGRRTVVILWSQSWAFWRDSETKEYFTMIIDRNWAEPLNCGITA